MSDKTLGGKKDKLITGINITPMVDIMLVLLIIFMVTATTIVKGSIDMKLPKASTAESASKSPVVVGVDKDGGYLVEGNPASEEELVAYLKANVEQDPEVEAVITGDERVAYGRIMQLINIVKKNGIVNFSAAVEKKEE
jgi:biopolymer transport protein ExbD